MKMQFKNSAIHFGLLIMASILFAACGNTDKKDENTGNGNVITKELVEAESSVSSEVSFKDKDGKIISVNSLKGKVVFINFWATWCPPCIHEMPTIDKLKNSFKDNEDIVFLMVDVDNKMENSLAFMQENNFDLPVYVPASEIPSVYLGSAIPTTVILDKRGEIIARMEGGRDYTSPEIFKALNELVKND